MFKIQTLTRFAMALAGLALALPLAAQETATLALRNGERPSGQLIDMNSSGIYLRINGQDRPFNPGDVAAVEFVVGRPPDAAVQRINAGGPVVVLRSGEVIEGRLVDIGGTSPLRLSVDTPGGRRDFMSNEVSQLYLNPVPLDRGAEAAPPPADVPAGAITVPANVQWTNTGVTVRRNTQLIIRGTGDINLGNNMSSGVGGSPAATIPGMRYPVQGAPNGALIGRVGNGRPFLIGDTSQPITVTGNGTLQLGVNDDNVADNTGAYHVTITR